MNETHVSAALKAIRMEAKVGVREMARRLGLRSPSTYAHYEDPNRFKDPFLPMAWALRFADALEPDGIDRSRIIALAGASQAISPDSVEYRLGLLSERRKQMLLDLLSDLEAAEAADQAQREKPAAD